MNTIPDLLRERAEVEARLKVILYDGSVEIKDIRGGKYLYIRRRLSGTLTSQYVGPYSQELHTLLLRHTAEARSLKKHIRSLERQLAH